MKKKKQDITKRKIIRKISDSGWVVEVPVTDNPDNPKAIIDMDVFGDLIANGLYPILSWDSVHEWIMAWSPVFRTRRRLARIIRNAPSDHEVEIIDGNEFNLRMTNIRLIPPPPPKQITYARDDFLSTKLGILSDIVDWEWSYDVAPPFKTDPLAEAYFNNPRIRDWHTMQAAQTAQQTKGF